MPLFPRSKQAKFAYMTASDPRTIAAPARTPLTPTKLAPDPAIDDVDTDCPVGDDATVLSALEVITSSPDEETVPAEVGAGAKPIFSPPAVIVMAYMKVARSISVRTVFVVAVAVAPPWATFSVQVPMLFGRSTWQSTVSVLWKNEYNFEVSDSGPNNCGMKEWERFSISLTNIPCCHCWYTTNASKRSTAGRPT